MYVYTRHIYVYVHTRHISKCFSENFLYRYRYIDRDILLKL